MEKILGPAIGMGNEMCQWVLKANGNVVPRRSVQPLTVAELNCPIEKQRREIFDQLIEQKWGKSIKDFLPPEVPNPEEEEVWGRKLAKCMTWKMLWMHVDC